MSEPDLSREFLEHRTDVFEQGRQQGKQEMLEWLEKEIKEEIEVLDLTEDYQRGQADALNELFYQAKKQVVEEK